METIKFGHRYFLNGILEPSTEKGTKNTNFGHRDFSDRNLEPS